MQRKLNDTQTHIGLLPREEVAGGVTPTPTLSKPLWRRFFRGIWCLLALAYVCMLPWLMIEFRKQSFDVKYQAWFVAGIFVVLTLPVSVYEVAMHLEYFSRPKLQLRVIRILWMVPIYALDAWFALRFKGARIYLDTIRECYEAYVIYNFTMFLMAYLEDEYGDVAAYFSTKEDVPHLWPLNYVLPTWPMGGEFFWQCKKGVLSYVIVRPLTTIAALVASLTGTYGENQWKVGEAYPWLALINSFAQMWALYCLVLMYQAAHEELIPIRPLSKFVVIKAVVFFSFWQSVAISILISSGFIRQNESWTTYDANDIGYGLQDFLICVEMFFAALAHAYAFPPRDYMSPDWQPRSFVSSIRIIFDVRDVVDDVTGVVDDTVQNTRETVADTAHRTWTATKAVANAAATAPPRAVMTLFNGRRGPGSRRSGGSGDFSDDDASDEEAQQLRPQYMPPPETPEGSPSNSPRSRLSQQYRAPAPRAGRR